MDKLLEVLEEIRPDVDFKNNKKLIDDGVLDSLNILEIVSELCDTLDIEILTADIIPSNFNSAEAMLAMIERLK